MTQIKIRRRFAPTTLRFGAQRLSNCVMAAQLISVRVYVCVCVCVVPCVYWCLCVLIRLVDVHVVPYSRINLEVDLFINRLQILLTRFYPTAILFIYIPVVVFVG